jgi:hypothetical protein
MNLAVAVFELKLGPASVVVFIQQDWLAHYVSDCFLVFGRQIVQHASRDFDKKNQFARFSFMREVYTARTSGLCPCQLPACQVRAFGRRHPAADASREAVERGLTDGLNPRLRSLLADKAHPVKL